MYDIINTVTKNKYFLIDNIKKNDIIYTFNTYKYFYCYDPVTAFIYYSIICGCIPIIEPVYGYTRDDYIKHFMTTNNASLIHGFAYGNTPDEITFAQNTYNLGLNEAYLMFSSTGVIDNFINMIDIYYNHKINNKLSSILTIEDVYYKDDIKPGYYKKNNLNFDTIYNNFIINSS